MIHQIRSSDTIYTIAADYLNNVNRWTELVTLNNLRFPYISDKPLEKLGVSIGSITLADIGLAGQRTLLIANTNNALLRHGVQIALSRYLASGSMLFDIVEIDSINPGSISLKTALQNNYPSGLTALLYPPILEQRGIVLSSGDYILISAPNADEQPSTILEDRFGRDLQVSNGHLVFTATGDLETIGGLANLTQQVQNRMQCPIGDMLMHPDYGSDVHSYLGQASNDTTRLLVQTAIARAAASDPRIQEVISTQTTIEIDRITASCTLLASNEAITLSLQLG